MTDLIMQIFISIFITALISLVIMKLYSRNNKVIIKDLTKIKNDDIGYCTCGLKSVCPSKEAICSNLCYGEDDDD